MNEAKQSRVLKETWWLALALVAVGFVFIGMVMARPRMLEYQGRSARLWLGDVFGPARAGSSQTEAIAAFRALGTNGVAFLVESLDQRERPLNEIYRGIFSILPSAAQSRLPPPVDLDTLANAASLVLMNVRDELPGRAFPSLVRLLEADNPRTRLHAAGVVKHYASNYRELNFAEFRSKLIGALRDPNDWIRIDIALVLSSARINVPELAAALTPSLTNSDAIIRSAARQTLANARASFVSTNHDAP